MPARKLNIITIWQPPISILTSIRGTAQAI